MGKDMLIVGLEDLREFAIKKLGYELLDIEDMNFEELSSWLETWHPESDKLMKSFIKVRQRTTSV